MKRGKISELIFTALGEASVCWKDTKDGVSGVPVGVFDSEQAKKIGNKLEDDIAALEEPNLGLATTRQLLDEIRARIEVDGQLDYRTVDEPNNNITSDEIEHRHNKPVQNNEGD
jgi:hypothetical protein